MQTPRGKGLALGHRPSHLRLWITVGLGLALDLASKEAAFRLLGAPPAGDGFGGTRILLPGIFRFVTSENPGVVFGFDVVGLLGLGHVAGRVFTALLTLVTCGLIVYLFASSLPRHRWTHVMCGLILAGALGNLYDRLVYGVVRDFLQITWQPTVLGHTLAWPYVFNAADVFLVVGVAGLAAALLFAPKQPAAEADREGSRAGG